MKRKVIAFFIVCLMAGLGTAFAGEEMDSATGWWDGELNFREHHVVDGVVPSHGGNTEYIGSGAEQVTEGWVASGGGFEAETGIFLQSSHDRQDIPMMEGLGFSQKTMQTFAQAITDDTSGPDTAGFCTQSMLDQELVIYREGGDGWTKRGSDGTLKGNGAATVFADPGSFAEANMSGFEAIGYSSTEGPVSRNIQAYMGYCGEVSVGYPPGE